MLNTLRQPRWMVITSVVVILAGLFVYLGFWQLSRRAERIDSNRRASAQLALPMVPISELDPVAGDVEYRRVSAEGEWLPEEEVLIRSQVHLGVAGFHVITPYTVDGGVVLVNRGWVPLIMDSTPVGPGPTPGPIEGWVHLTQERGWLSPEDPPGELTVFNRVDVDRIAAQIAGDVNPFYIVQIVEDDGQLPAPLDLPEFTDEGPHLAYAIQWFGFAIVGLVGMFFLVRRNSRG